MISKPEISSVKYGHKQVVTTGKFANGAVTAAMAYAFNQALAEEVARGWKVRGMLDQVEDLNQSDLELLFERRFPGLNADIFKQNVRDQSLHDVFENSKALREAVTNIVEAEYRSAGLGGVVARRVVARAISSRLHIPEQDIMQLMRAEKVIQEVNSIEPTLKGVAEGIRQGNQEVLRVWYDD